MFLMFVCVCVGGGGGKIINCMILTKLVFLFDLLHRSTLAYRWGHAPKFTREWSQPLPKCHTTAPAYAARSADQNYIFECHT